MPVGLGVGALLALAILWKVPQWQVGGVRRLDAKERFDRVNEARKTLATILGGIVLLAGFFGTWQNIRVAEESASTSQRALIISQEGQITDRFTKAIEQLGAVDVSGKKKLEVRLGGIYALERIANDSERDHWPIMEVLCTYVRENAPNRRGDPAREQQKPKKPVQKSQASPEPAPLAADIQAILTVLGRRDRRYEREGQHLDLTKTDLRGANLREADLSQADLSQATLRGAYLDDAVLRWADLSEANLREAHFSGADLKNADLGGANLFHADLGGANLIEANLREADLRGADLEEAYLIEANLREADLREADLLDADLRGADLEYARHLTQGQIDGAFGDAHRILPDNLHMPESWKK